MFFNFYSNVFNCIKNLNELVKSNVRYRYQQNSFSKFVLCLLAKGFQFFTKRKLCFCTTQDIACASCFNIGS